ncbi:unnamed protein product [Sympodiomycopsis kandeliae]
MLRQAANVTRRNAGHTTRHHLPKSAVSSNCPSRSSSQQIVSPLNCVTIPSPGTLSFSTSTLVNKAKVKRSHNRKFIKGSKPSRKAKATPAWKQRQDDLRDEIRKLQAKATRLDKLEESHEATKDLPELDDELLDQIYAGVKEVEPVPSHEKTLLLSQEQKKLDRYTRVVQSLQQTLPDVSAMAISNAEAEIEAAPLSFSQRMEVHLEALTQRLIRIQHHTQTEGQPSSSATQQSIADLRSETDILRDMLQTVKIEEEQGLAVEEQEGEEGEGEELDEVIGEASSSDAPAAPAEENVEGVEVDERDYKDFQTIDFAEQGHSQSAAFATTTQPPPEVENLAHNENIEVAEPSLLQQTQSLVGIIDTLSERSPRESFLALRAIPQQEWAALGTLCAAQDQVQLRERLIHLLDGLDSEQGGVPTEPLVQFHTALADGFANRGEVQETKNAISKMLESSLPLTPLAQHALVKAHLRSDPATTSGGVASAMSIINSLEEAGEPAPQATYSLVLSHLLDNPDMEVKDEVWGVWNRMRLNAYPVPDAVVWSNMLRACALGSTPARHTGIALQEAHRGAKYARPKQTISELKGKEFHRGESETAMDLFREMTLVEGVRPNPACYDHLILACCRGHDKNNYLEGFRLLSEMITTAQELNISAFEPTRTTYNALLEGCKRAKDLLRSRWILAEMIRSSSALWSAPAELSWQQRAKLHSRMPDAETVGKVFLTYAAWKPKKVAIAKKADGSSSRSEAGQQRSEAVEQQHTDSIETDSSVSPSSEVTSPSDPESRVRSLSQPEMDEAATSFSSTPPSTSAEAVREVRGLLARIVMDQADDGQVRGPMSDVVPSTRLLNSYLSVLNAHLRSTQLLEALSGAVQGDSSLFAKMGLEPNAHTFVLVMEACISRGTKEKELATELATWAWASWRSMESDLLSGKSTESAVTRRTISDIWSNRITFLSKVNKLDEAMATLKEFISIYPPMSIPSQDQYKPRKMPYFDFNVIKTNLIKRDHLKLEKLKEVAQRVESSWRQSSQVSIKPLASKEDGADGSSTMIEEAQNTPESPLTKMTNSETPLPVSFTSSTSSSTSLRAVFYPRPPSMTFFNLNLLHQRITLSNLQERPNKVQELKLIAWACRVWESRAKE